MDSNHSRVSPDELATRSFRPLRQSSNTGDKGIEPSHLHVATDFKSACPHGHYLPNNRSGSRTQKQQILSLLALPVSLTDPDTPRETRTLKFLILNQTPMPVRLQGHKKRLSAWDSLNNKKNRSITQALDTRGINCIDFSFS